MKKRFLIFNLILIISLIILSSCSVIGKNEIGFRLKGFEISKYYNEQIKSYIYDPEVKVYINAPAEENLKLSKPTKIIFYTLPNGNTTEQTFGKKLKEGVDWHFGIQHIGAQTRRLREVLKDENIIVVYLEAEKRSWPTWRKTHTDNAVLIPKIVEDIMKNFSDFKTSIILSGHSGGGSFIFGYINGFEKIPDNVERICFLDANYAYEDEMKHGDKIIDWLKSNPKHSLVVLCYDDRKVILNGKRIVSDKGGTWGRTESMVERLQKDMPLKKVSETDCIRYRSGDQIDIIMHTNPKSQILHTVLVGDMNGFIHAITTGTKFENKAAIFNGNVAYEKWIQED